MPFVGVHLYMATVSGIALLCKAAEKLGGVAPPRIQKGRIAVMFETMIFLIVVGGGCWCLKQWLGYLERKQLADKLAQRPANEGRAVTPTEIERYQATVTELWQPPEAKKGGMNKWLVIGLCALYIICPIDFIPDFIPVLGWSDDLVAAIIAVRTMFN